MSYANTYGFLSRVHCISVFWHIDSERIIVFTDANRQAYCLHCCFMFHYTINYLFWLLLIKLLFLVILILFINDTLLVYYGIYVFT
jgi:hypothetical protein